MYINIDRGCTMIDVVSISSEGRTWTFVNVMQVTYPSPFSKVEVFRDEGIKKCMIMKQKEK